MKTISKPSGKVSICGVGIDRFSFDQVVEIILDHLKSPNPEPRYVVTPNAQHILLLQRDEHLRRVYRDAFLVVPDGVSLLYAARLLGAPLRGRVNGTDLFEYLCRIAAREELGIYLLGGRPDAADISAQVLRDRYPTLRIAGTYCPPYGFEDDPCELAAIQRSIRAAAPDILFVGLGTPKQEFWIYANHGELNVPLSIGIGASFDFVSGIIRRAPRLLQKIGLEWLFRLLTEPRRLWRRYLISNPLFVMLVLCQAVGFCRDTGESPSSTTERSQLGERDA